MLCALQRLSQEMQQAKALLKQSEAELTRLAMWVRYLEKMGFVLRYAPEQLGPQLAESCQQAQARPTPPSPEAVTVNLTSPKTSSDTVTVARLAGEHCCCIRLSKCVARGLLSKQT